MTQRPLVGQSLFIIDASRSHSLDIPHSVGLPRRVIARRRDLSLMTQNSHKRQISTEASERLQIRVLDRAASGIGRKKDNIKMNFKA